MTMINSVSFLVLALCWATASASGLEKPALPVLRTRNVPGTSDADTWHAVRRALSDPSLVARGTHRSNATSLDKSWDNAVLFSWTEEAEAKPKAGGKVTATDSIEIVCTTCYIKGTAQTEFTISDNFNASKAFHNVTDQFGHDVEVLADGAIKYLHDFIDDTMTDTAHKVENGDFNFNDITPPTLDFDFDNLTIPELPECSIGFTFEDLELYVMIDTKLSASVTYSLNLYTSDTPVGFGVGNDLDIGVVFVVDLILSVDGEIDISSGFHIQLDHVAMEISMFSKHVSEMNLKGGHFEFLPVTIESVGVVFEAVLRLGITAGIDVATPSLKIGGLPVADTSAGVEVGIFAKMADFVANVTRPDDVKDLAKCPIQVEESFQLALGANAGATVAIGEFTWGPVPSTEIPVFYTTMSQRCASTRKATTVATAEPSATLDARDDGGKLTRTTLTTEVAYTGVGCKSTGLVNCPVSLQSTTKTTVTKTLVTAVPSGADPTFPASTHSVVHSPIKFGDGAQKVAALSGSPTSYVPPPTSTSSSGSSTSTAKAAEDGKKDSHNHHHRNAIIIGVCVGLGGPLVIGAAAAGLLLLWRRKRQHEILDKPYNSN